MAKPFYKCVLLVLASNNKPLYRYFKRAYESYMDRNPLVKVLFVYGNGVPFEAQEHDLVYLDIDESYNTPCMALKTVRAFDYIDQNFCYDYLVRTNLSTFWVLDKLLEKIDLLPKTRCVAGRPAIFPPPYVTGISMFISSDLVPLIVRDVETAIYKTPKYTPEDRMICDYFTLNHGVTVREFDVLKIVENLESNNIEAIEECMKTDRAGFRIKNLKNRELIDTTLISTLCRKFYDVEIGEFDNGYV